MDVPWLSRLTLQNLPRNMINKLLLSNAQKAVVLTKVEPVSALALKVPLFVIVLEPDTETFFPDHSTVENPLIFMLASRVTGKFTGLMVSCARWRPSP